MRNIALATVLATTALSAPAMARDGAFYIGIDAGGMIIQNIQYDLRDAAGVRVNQALTENHSVGYDVSGNIGYDFGIFRTEFEVGYKSATLDTVTTNASISAARGRFQR